LTVLTLLTKTYNKGQLKQIEMSLQTIFEDLDAQVQILDKQSNRWVKVKITGEDEVVAKNYITKQIGICPTSLDEVSSDTEFKGYIQKIDTTGTLIVDIGILEPKTVYAHIPLTTLQTQLLEGKEISLKKIAELFALSADLPISIKVKGIHAVENIINAELSTTQVEKLKNWQDSLLERLIVLGATTDEITLTLERTQLNRDIINTEALGLFEQVLTCKLGTNAAGIIPRIGRYMRNTQFLVFNPKNFTPNAKNYTQIL